MKHLRAVQRRSLICLTVIASLAVTAVMVSDLNTFTGSARAEPSEVSAVEPSNADAQVAQGKYLVHHVAQCVECHTPRDERGELIESQLLTGAPIPVMGPDYAQPWAAASASLAGLGNYDEAFVRYLLTHGEKPDGSRPKSPMPQFRLTDEDAAAVIAYLRSL